LTRRPGSYRVRWDVNLRIAECPFCYALTVVEKLAGHCGQDHPALAGVDPVFDPYRQVEPGKALNDR
jgi:hypothetical protein